MTLALLAATFSPLKTSAPMGVHTRVSSKTSHELSRPLSQDRLLRLVVPPILQERTLPRTSYAITAAERNRLDTSTANIRVAHEAYAVAMLNEALAQPNSKTLDVRHRGLNDHAVRQLLTALRLHGTIDAVLLDGNPISDKIALDIADLILYNPHIKVISLGQTLFSDIGVTHLIPAASRAPSLRVIDVNNTLVTEPYRLHLSSVVAKSIEKRSNDAADAKSTAEGSEEDEWRAKHGLRPIRPLPVVANKSRK